MAQSLPLYFVDAFTDRIFRGNPAAVTLVDSPLSDSTMQQIAAEINLSETAFVGPSEKGSRSLRWFTPTVEVELCGHATLASSAVLFAVGLETDTVKFQTRSGELTCHQKGAGVAMDFPAAETRELDIPEFARQLVGDGAIAAARTGVSHGWLVLEYPTPELVADLRPEFAAFHHHTSDGIIATAACHDGNHDYHCRVFVPQYGIDEDPVTGSANVVLADYWQKRLGKDAFKGWQASTRGGELIVRRDGDRCWLEGQAVMTFQGKLCLDTIP